MITSLFLKWMWRFFFFFLYSLSRSSQNDKSLWKQRHSFERNLLWGGLEDVLASLCLLNANILDFRVYSSRHYAWVVTEIKLRKSYSFPSFLSTPFVAIVQLTERKMSAIAFFFHMIVGSVVSVTLSWRNARGSALIPILVNKIIHVS